MKDSYFHNPTSRIFCYFGDIADSFIDESLQIWTMEEMLHRDLKLHGYERIVYMDYQEGTHCLDDRSFQLLTGGAPQLDPVPLGLLGGSLLLPGAPPAGATAGRQQERSLTTERTEMLHNAEGYIQDAKVKTAVIFQNAGNLLIEACRADCGRMIRDFLYKLDKINDPLNQNLWILMFGQSIAKATDLFHDEQLDDLWEELKKRSRFHRIPGPTASEVRLLLHHLRLTGIKGKRLQLDLRELDKMCRMLSGKILSSQNTKDAELKTPAPGELAARQLKELHHYLVHEVILQDKTLDMALCLRMCGQNASMPALQKLDTLIGMDSLKKTVRDFINSYAKDRQNAPEPPLRLEPPRGTGDEPRLDLNVILLGKQGTGKTTAARILGEIYAEYGLLSSGHVIETRPVELVGRYIGHSEAKMRDVIGKAKGGVLFFDEAYSFATGSKNGETNTNSFYQAMVDLLVGSMTDRGCDYAVILAGYEDKMEALWKMNPGLRGRFKTEIHIQDYTAPEMAKIFHMQARKIGRTVSPELDEKLETIFESWYADQQNTWANGRVAQKLAEKMKDALATAAPGSTVLGLEQLPENCRQYVTGEKERDAMTRLQEMVGLQNVKNEVINWANDLEFSQSQNQRLQHFIFAGNPGTGKTSVAEIFGAVMKNYGVLKSGMVRKVEAKDLTSVQDFVSIIKSCRDKVLFIDEAYKLLYRPELIDLLVEYTNPDKTDFPFCVICAGYEKNMEEFKRYNEGTSSRFQPILFDNYTPEDLCEIMKLVLDKAYRNYVITDAFIEGSLAHFRTHVDRIAAEENGRYIRKYLKGAERILNAQLKARYGTRDNTPAEAYRFTADTVPVSFCN